MKRLLMFAVFVTLLCQVCQVGMAQGTKASGTVRTWNRVKGDRIEKIQATYVKTENGTVILNWNHQVPNPKDKNKKNSVTTVLKIPLTELSEEDRQWIEHVNPIRSCLDAKSHKGEVGTLIPPFGEYKVTHKIDRENAIIAYHNNPNPIWEFWLHSAVVEDLEEGKIYRSIPEDTTEIKSEVKINKNVAGKHDVVTETHTLSKTEGRNIDKTKSMKKNEINFKVVGQQTYESSPLMFIEDNF